ncbi:MAG: hypothetical protein RLZZ396_2781, partial [Planctomycetota bacterium]
IMPDGSFIVLQVYSRVEARLSRTQRRGTRTRTRTRKRLNRFKTITFSGKWEPLYLARLFTKSETLLFEYEYRFTEYEYEYEKNQWYELPAVIMPDGHPH